MFQTKSFSWKLHYHRSLQISKTVASSQIYEFSRRKNQFPFGKDERNSQLVDALLSLSMFTFTALLLREALFELNFAYFCDHLATVDSRCWINDHVTCFLLFLKRNLNFLFKFVHVWKDFFSTKWKSARNAISWMSGVKFGLIIPPGNISSR